MKNGQINQIFTSIFAMIIIGVVVVFSVIAITSLFQNKCDTDFVLFKNNIRNLVEKNDDYGVMQSHSLTAPCNNVFLCFIDSNANYIFHSSNNLFPANFPYTLAKSMTLFNNGTSYMKNVFLYDNQFLYDLDYLPSIRIPNENKIICIPKKNGKFEFMTRGLGTGIEIIANPDIFDSAILVNFANPVENIIPGTTIEMNILVDVNRFDTKLTEADIRQLASNQIENIESIEIVYDKGTNQMVFKVIGTTAKNFLGIFPLPVNIEQNINGNGQTENIYQSWWDFLTT